MSPVKTQPKPLIQRQQPMTRMLFALSPICLAATYYFGLRVLLVLAVCNLAAFLVEYAFCRQYGEPVSSAIFVTGTLFALSLPPVLPIWMAVVGVVAGVLFGKMVFGGFGRNVFNPALVGRAFIYVAFPVHMTARWGDPVGGPAGGFVAWMPDALTGSTPMKAIQTGHAVDRMAAFTGDIGGSVGETCAALIIVAGLYLVLTKTANWRIVVSGFIGFAGLQTMLWKSGVEGAFDPLTAALVGSWLIGIFFFATEPVSAPKEKTSLWIYGFTIGALNVLIKTFSAWDGAMTFSILLANMFAPITDHAVKALKRWRATS